MEGCGQNYPLKGGIYQVERGELQIPRIDTSPPLRIRGGSRMKSFEYNNPDLKKRRRDLRRNATEAEKRLWQRLKNKQMRGVRFLRQYSVGSYILDFYSPKKRLAIGLVRGPRNDRVFWWNFSG